ncbi:MAG: DMT family transporter [Gaiellaceae bacterium]
MRWNLSVAGLAASWGFIAIIVAGVDLDAVVLVFYRLALAALTVAAGLVLLRRRELFRLPALRARTIAAGAGLAVHWFLFFLTIKLASVAVAVLTVYTAPIFLSLLAPVFLPEARRRVALAALVPGGAGIALIALGGGDGTEVRPLAIATGLAAALTYAGVVISTKHLTARLPVLTIEVWYFSIAALLLAPFLLGASRVRPEGVEILYLLVLGVVFTAVSGVLYVWLLAHVSAQVVGVLGYLEPVSAAVLAWVLLGQPLGLAVVAGGALVVAAGVLVVLREPGDAGAVEVPLFQPLPSAADSD